MPATVQLQATTDTGSIPVPPVLSVSGTPVPPPGGKQWHHSSNQGMPNSVPEEEEAPEDVLEEASTKSEGL